MLKTEAVQRLCGHLEQKSFHQRRLQDLGERGVVLADQADLDEARRDRHRIAAGALGGCPYRREHLGVVLRRPCAGRPPAIGVPPAISSIRGPLAPIQIDGSRSWYGSVSSRA